MTIRPKIFSFFSGCGLLDLGFEDAGYEIAFVNEYSKAFLDAYSYSRKSMNRGFPQYGYHNTDIEEYLGERHSELQGYIQDARKSNELIGFIGGPPCPDFSVGGKNKGREGKNGRLSQVYFKLICEMQPDFFLFENVKGLWRTKLHREFYEEMKAYVVSAGYSITEKLTNSLEFGVPQDRERIMLFGARTHTSDSIKTAGKLTDFEWDKYKKYDRDDVKKYNWPECTPFSEAQNSDVGVTESKYEDLTVLYWFLKNKVDAHPNSKAHFTPRAGLTRMQTIHEGDVSKKSYKRLHRQRYSPTAAYGNNEVHLHPYHARRISASEALAIQSVPENFVLSPSMTLSGMFKTIGNGVPYLLSLSIAKTIMDYLEEQKCKR